ASSQVDARADVYALGMILYELLTGTLPLRDSPLGELLRRLVAGAIPSPKEIRPALSESVSKIVLKALRPLADERYASAAELAQALKQTGSPDAPFSETAVTAVIPNPVLQGSLSERAHSRADALPRSLDPPPTRREVPLRERPSGEQEVSAT